MQSFDWPEFQTRLYEIRANLYIFILLYQQLSRLIVIEFATELNMKISSCKKNAQVILRSPTFNLKSYGERKNIPCL